jgi:hypothetical protein
MLRLKKISGPGRREFAWRTRTPIYADIEVPPVLREYIVSEAMTALGIPSTRSLAAVMSGETVARETPLPGGMRHKLGLSTVQ